MTRLRHRWSNACASVTALGRTSARVALAAALLLLPLLSPATTAAAPPWGVSDPAVSPTKGDTSTRVTFSVTYRSPLPTAPDAVRVIVGDKSYQLTAAGGDHNWNRGVRFSVTTRLPVGTHHVRFESIRGHYRSHVNGPDVQIKAKPKPKPKPKPDPKPTPKPKPKPKPKPDPTPHPKPKPKPHPKPKPKPAHRADPKPARNEPKPRSTSKTDQPATTGADPTAAPSPSPSPAPTPTASPDETLNPVIAAVIVGADRGSNGGGSGGDGTGSGTDGSGGSGSVSDSLATRPASLVSILAAVAPTAIATTGGVAMMMAFMVFGKRRRDGEPTAPDDVLAAQAARGSGVVPTSGMVGSTVMPGAAVAATAVQAAIGPVPAMEDIDAHLPRWRRPSLMEARKTDPTRRISTNVRLSFDGDVGSAVTGMERRLIRYRLVSLLSDPDEIRGQEIGVLDEGDEVVLLEKHGTYWRVLCPDGREGWLHKMTLGDTVIDSQTAGADSWTSGDGGPVGGFEDVLRAYQEHRNQFGEA